MVPRGPCSCSARWLLAQAAMLAALAAAARGVVLDGLDGSPDRADPLWSPFGPERPPPPPPMPPPLRLTPLLEAGDVARARDLAAVPPLLPACCDSYAGFLTVDKHHDSNLFFWFFRAETRRSEAPLVVWLQGGPGTSLMRAVFEENGPYQIDTRSRRLARRRGSWTREHSVLYFDNPVGTGYSFTASPAGLATNTTQIAQSLVEALRQFFIMFPGQRSRDLYIAGESFGGKMATALAHALLPARGPATPAATAAPNLKGLIVVNGLVEMESQLDKSDIAFQLGLVDAAGRAEMRALADEQVRLIRQGRWDLAIELGVDECGGNISPLETGMVFVTNFLLWNGTQDEGFQDLAEHEFIRRALHVGNATFSGRSHAVAVAMRNDIGPSVLPELGAVADSSVRVLVVSGQMDLCTPYRLTANFLRKMTWGGAGELDAAPRVPWCVRGQLAGWARTVRGLTHVLVRNAGHYLCQDQPRLAADMLGKFSAGAAFDTCEERLK